VIYALVGGASAATVGRYLVLVLIVCGVIEILIRKQGPPVSRSSARAIIPALAVHTGMIGGIGARFDQIRANTVIQSFLAGAGPAVIGAIAGSAIPLGLALQHGWQIPVLAGATLWLFVIRRGVVSGLLTAGATGVALALAGVSL
jgi:hypothetical protein